VRTQCPVQGPPIHNGKRKPRTCRGLKVTS
jgi:hypothetical protein